MDQFPSFPVFFTYAAEYIAFVSPAKAQTCYIGEDDLEFLDHLASSSPVLGLQCVIPYRVLCGGENQSQDFVHARQAFCQLSCRKPHFGVTFVVVQPQWVRTFQGRGMWLRKIRQNRQRYKRNTET